MKQLGVHTGRAQCLSSFSSKQVLGRWRREATLHYYNSHSGCMPFNCSSNRLHSGCTFYNFFIPLRIVPLHIIENNNNGRIPLGIYHSYELRLGFTTGNSKVLFSNLNLTEARSGRRLLEKASQIALCIALFTVSNPERPINAKGFKLLKTLFNI
ncbi:unnamed protein product [Leptidea sinapis]|uniref:Uncharacterized protein n=1 Tax=Leptidea sinapis TaxID=189913 RepID=A0A5E4QG99_9NEOP|nr:unnamed protein product [Leptidea sinapis]